MHDVRLAKRAAKDMDDLPDEIGQRIHATLPALVENPRPTGSRKLKGTTDTYRIRIGDYRALYDAETEGIPS